MTINPRRRPLWRRRAETPEGTAILAEARRLSRQEDYAHLSDGELLRLAYWDTSGEPDLVGRAALEDSNASRNRFMRFIKSDNGVATVIVLAIMLYFGTVITIFSDDLKKAPHGWRHSHSAPCR